MEQGFQSTDKQEDLQENDEEEDIQSKNKQEDPLAMSKEELWGLFEQRLRAKNLRFEDIRGASDRKEVLKVLGFTNSISLARLETIWEEQKQKPVTKQVRISGEVTNPGTYDVPVNATWGDLVRRAGGFTETGDDLFLESSHRLDRDHYIVPALPWLERGENHRKFSIIKLLNRYIFQLPQDSSQLQVQSQDSGLCHKLELPSQLQHKSLGSQEQPSFYSDAFSSVTEDISSLDTKYERTALLRYKRRTAEKVPKFDE
eukprot:TRINITY_DN4725_c0_g1_i1.p1 TRINITY_DN4725_c0_g1~~TRINITY_DN4725_c0_g1_i1.p1  ORF type:complete len:258 (+),score=24.52 TRINITY_DN4725_c0_g1_i1:76-849(+)